MLRERERQRKGNKNKKKIDKKNTQKVFHLKSKKANLLR